MGVRETQVGDKTDENAPDRRRRPLPRRSRRSSRRPARRPAIDRMVENAALMGANAVVAMRFDSSEIGETMSEIVAYGTAVVLEK